jgi:hypothetical protein
MVDKSLIDYIKDGKKKGYSREELEKILKESGWSNLEITEGFASVEGGKPAAKPVAATSMSKDQVLSSFINKALEKGYSKDKIRQSLLSKGWPIGKVNTALGGTAEPAKEVEKPKAKPVVTRGKGFSAKKLFLYIMWFIIISTVLTVSISVFFYIQGMINYTVTDPNTGAQVTGVCLQEDCSDMREFVMEDIMNKLVLILSIALSIALVLVLLHAFLPQKEWVVWVADILFFLYILYLLYLWFFTG